MFNKICHCTCIQQLSLLEERIKKLEDSAGWYTEERRTQSIAEKVANLLTEKAGQYNFNAKFIGNLVSMINKVQVKGGKK